MEVATIISSDRETFSLLDKFIYDFPLFRYRGKDHNTSFFYREGNEKDMIYYHFLFLDANHEFSYNYSEEDVSTIKRKYGEKKIYLLDISYSTENTLLALIKAFKSYVLDHDEKLVSNILISHTFDGLKSLSTDY